MVDHNVDEVTMVRRLPDGTPDVTPGAIRLLSDEEAEAVDRVQLDAIEAAARGRVQVVPATVEAPEAPVVNADPVVQVGVVGRDPNAGIRVAPGAVGSVAKDVPGQGLLEPGAKAEAGLQDVTDPESGDLQVAGGETVEGPGGPADPSDDGEG